MTSSDQISSIRAHLWPAMSASAFVHLWHLGENEAWVSRTLTPQIVQDPHTPQIGRGGSSPEEVPRHRAAGAAGRRGHWARHLPHRERAGPSRCRSRGGSCPTAPRRGTAAAVPVCSRCPAHTAACRPPGGVTFHVRNPRLPPLQTQSATQHLWSLHTLQSPCMT